MWFRTLPEGHKKVLRAAALAGTVFNEIHDRRIEELSDSEVLRDLTDQINEARYLVRQSESWDLTGAGSFPVSSDWRKTDVSFALLPTLPLQITLHQRGHNSPEAVSCEVRTLRGMRVVQIGSARPSWNEPFESFIVGDAVKLDVPAIIRQIKVNR
jgi:hypothetical protein